MPSRRMFLAGLLASGVAPRASWADAGSPAYLSAARLPSGAYALFGLNAGGQVVFEIPLPGRGHAAAAHPSQPLAVAFARRPGRFALVINCADGTVKTRLDAPPGFHFYGHGTFTADGSVLCTSENDFNNARGMIGLWDVRNGFARLGAIPSGGIGPHELRLMPDGETLVVANGGIETHPDAGRQKLNLPEMRPNLSYVSLDGATLDQHQPPPEWHQNSIRHLALRKDGLVAIACQWQGNPTDTPPLLATHRRGQNLAFHDPGTDIWRDMQGYLGSVSFSGSGAEIAVTGPRGGVALITDASGQPQRLIEQPDICGAAPGASGFVFTTGQGLVLEDAGTSRQMASEWVAWDNHLVSVA
ncbi:DUF1513 domain-containing protein [Roseovarius aestuarii]|uniref:DUF1513 domain-containing protein n=1 Tax=Roseovarius aestuarii TaxID=475083 RepID=A0A1X7BV25_9RHOB|nr:DUF1513 domain-containing protein [Roseovarius aestuarii]SMC13335.1 hypothetical protein ROA7745_03181 [Roseovarius aestuarii]